MDVPAGAGARDLQGYDVFGGVRDALGVRVDPLVDIEADPC